MSVLAHAVASSAAQRPSYLRAVRPDLSPSPSYESSVESLRELLTKADAVQNAVSAALHRGLSEGIELISTTLRDELVNRVERVRQDLARERDARRFGEYLQALEEAEVPVPKPQRITSRRMWRRLSAEHWFPAPSVTRHEDGTIAFAWDSGSKRHHLDAIVYRDGGFEWFFFDRATQERAGTDGDPERTVPEPFLALAHHVI